MIRNGVKSRIALEHTCGLEPGAIPDDVSPNIQTKLDRTRDTFGGFFDLPKKTNCKHPEHDPPKHLHIPQGKGYRHVCPSCGNTVDLIPPQTTL